MLRFGVVNEGQIAFHLGHMANGVFNTGVDLGSVQTAADIQDRQIGAHRLKLRAAVIHDAALDVRSIRLHHDRQADAGIGGTSPQADAIRIDIQRARVVSNIGDQILGINEARPWRLW